MLAAAHKFTISLTAAAVALAITGCARGPQAWAEKTLTMQTPAGDLTALHVATQNGAISVRGEERADVEIRADLRAGARTRDAANECLAAIELISEYAGEGVHRIGWRWTRPQHTDWSASVAFHVVMPDRLKLTASTHNGAVDVVHVSAPCTLKSSNGAITAREIADSITATTHNGSITCTARGPNVQLVSHNGAISLSAPDATALGGRVETHNGQIMINVGTSVSAELVCHTDNGKVTCDAPITARERSRTDLRGTLGNGGEALTAITRNGAIQIRTAD